MLEVEEGLTWRQLRRVRAAAEQLGYDGLWLSDHLDSAARPGAGGLEAWTALAVVAAESRRIQLGPLVTPVTFRAPALIARMAVTLDDLSGGRFVLGLGAGWNEAEHVANGLSFPGAAERSARLIEALELLQRTLPKRRLPILIGGAGERRTLPIVARYADEWNLTTADPTLCAMKSERLAVCCEAVGRDPASIRHSVSVGFVVGRSADELAHRVQALRRLVPPLVSAPPAALGWLAGTPEELVAQLGALARVGVERVMLNHYDADDDASLELIAREVMPRVGDR
ncbi:MAG: LLM class flavin-dependent oxidoreductase [Chloroflexi bacterium]|nr:LLM class flavin-dependent oxidoreductase [Chloroflexota bacterium]